VDSGPSRKRVIHTLERLVAIAVGGNGLPTDELVPLVERLLEVPQQLIRTFVAAEVA
jgi:hypothetical protein